MKYSPGPWLAEFMKKTTGKNEYWIKFDEYASIASVRHGADDEEYGGMSALEANARLIASAPDMVDALKHILSVYNDTERYPLVPMAELRKLIETTLAKATGGEE